MHLRSIAIVLAALVSGVFVACGGKTEGDAPGGTKPCDGCQVVPTATQVSCSPTASSAIGCHGIPRDPWGSASATASATASVFPIGCRITYPHENPYYPGTPQTCDCESISTAREPEWVCPL